MRLVRIARGLALLPWYGIVFCVVFGRLPRLGELRALHDVAGRHGSLAPHTTFRSVLSRFDHQDVPTAFGVRLTAQDVRIVEYAGVKVALDNAEPIIGRYIERGEYEPHMVAFYRSVLRPGMRVVDVGANIGLFSLLAARHVGESGCVYSIEPSGENGRLLLYSAALNGFTNIRLLPTAVGDHEGYALFLTHLGANGGLLTAKRGEPRRDMAKEMGAMLNPNCRIVPMTRLDTLIDGPVEMIKLDIEGAEGLALRGATELLRKHRPLITSEASAEMLGRVSGVSLRDYLEITRRLDYRQFLIGRKGRPLQEICDLDGFLAEWTNLIRIEDFAFVPREKADEVMANVGVQLHADVSA